MEKRPTLAALRALWAKTLSNIADVTSAVNTTTTALDSRVAALEQGGGGGNTVTFTVSSAAVSANVDGTDTTLIEFATADEVNAACDAVFGTL